jgi:hypothetical protein
MEKVMLHPDMGIPALVDALRTLQKEAQDRGRRFAAVSLTCYPEKSQDYRDDAIWSLAQGDVLRDIVERLEIAEDGEQEQKEFQEIEISGIRA